MSAVLLHSPADVLRWALVYLGVATDPTLPVLLAWPCYAGDESNAPDDCVTVHGTTPVTDGFGLDGEGWFHRGFQVRLRGSTETTLAAKAEEVCKALNEGITWTTITVTDPGTGSRTTYNLAAVACGAPSPLGKDSPNTRRRLVVLNGTMALTRYDDL